MKFLKATLLILASFFIALAVGILIVAVCAYTVAYVIAPLAMVLMMPISAILIAFWWQEKKR